MAGRNGEAVVPYISEVELAAVGLSKEAAKQLLQDVIIPEMRAYELSPWNGDAFKNGSTFSVKFDILWKGERLPAGVTVIDTPRGPRVFLGVIAVFCLRSIETFGKRTADPEWPAHFNRVAQRLKDGGLPGVWDLPSGRIEQWPKR